LLADKYKDSEFRASLDIALADGVKRVGRLVNQMRFLSRDSVSSQETFPLAPLIEEAFQEAKKHQTVKSSELKLEAPGNQSIFVEGDRAALKHALSEVMLNALQANPADAQIGVRAIAAAEGNGAANGGSDGVHGKVSIEVEDNGAGFTVETARKVPEPFFTTRNVGLGLGLTVTQKIIETHHGKLEIVNPALGRSGLVRISLPAETVPLKKPEKSGSRSN
jgi:signal transduction histidine kinase